MKRFLLVLAGVVLVIGSLTVPAFSADDEGVVSVTANMSQVSVTVNPSSVNYGVVNLDSNNNIPMGNPRINAQNTGNWWADMAIKGADTNLGWILGSAAAEDTYVHYFGQGNPPTLTYNPLDTDWQPLGAWDSYAPSSGEGFWLKMDTPTTINTSSIGTQSTTVTVMVSLVDTGIQMMLEAGGPYPDSATTAPLTATVTDQDDNPVTGIAANLSSMVFLGNPPISPPLPVPPATFTEIGTTGVYTGDLDISSLDHGTYLVVVPGNSGSLYATGGDELIINP